jgi:sulfatase modifying factor 1
MAFSAGRFGRILRGVLRISLLAGLASCSKTTVAGVVLKFETDGTLDPDTLHVTITANGRTPLDWCYPITNPSTFFPTTLAIAPNGDPTETVAVTASVLRAGVTLDVRQNYITEVPNDRVLELDILFSGKCNQQVSSVVAPPHGTNCPYGVAASLCPTGKTCDGTTGMCVSNLVPPGDLLDAGTDGGSTESPDATLADGAEGSNDASDASTDIGSEATDVVAPSADASGDALPPSCAPGGPGMTNCGPGGSGTENCCTSLEVEGGTYYRTYDVDAGNVVVAADGGPTGEADPATVSSFRLDKYLVTVGRFRQFVNAVLPPHGGASWLPQAGSGKHTHLRGGLGLVNVDDDAGSPYEPGWLTSDDSNVAPTDTNLMAVCGSGIWTNAAGSRENLPINCVNWYEAYAFCIWDGGFLPSEAEWEYAAAAGNLQREYPWGSTDPGASDQYSIYNCYYPNRSNACGDVNAIAPVGYARDGAGLWGQLDLSGDVYGWSLDWYVASYFDPCTDCAVVTATSGASERVARGDSYDGQSIYSWERNDYDPHDRDSSLGFRCARIP